MGKVSTLPPRAAKPILAEVIVGQLRERIIDGTYAAGAQLSEVELAGRFATSRAPVREALLRLVEEGLVDSVPHRGMTVRRLRDEDLDDLYLARSAIEHAVIARVIDRGPTPELLQSLRGCLADLAYAVELGRWDAVVAADLSFHQRLVDEADSERVSKMFAAVVGQTRMALNLLVGTNKGHANLVEEHTQVCDLIAARDLPGALAALDTHFAEALTTLHAAARTGLRPAEAYERDGTDRGRTKR